MCGNILNLEQESIGNVSYVRNNARNSKISLDSVTVDKEGDIEDYDEIDEIETTLSEVRFKCDSCGDYIILSDFE